MSDNPPSNTCKKTHPCSTWGNPRYKNPGFSQKVTLQEGKYPEAQEENCKGPD